MIEILTVCTGNICRSPLAALALADRTTALPVHVSSAGTRARPGIAMPAEAQQLAIAAGVDRADAEAHRSRYLSEAIAQTPRLTLAMTREHRRTAIEYAPGALRSTFTIREFARLAASLDDEALLRAANEGRADPAARLRATLAAVAAQRGLPETMADDPADDDVIDPFGQPFEVYERSAAQLMPAVDETVRVLRLALG